MTDTSGVVPAIEGDRTGGPWVELWGDWLQCVYVLSARFRSLLEMWVAYIMFTVRTCGGKPFCPLLFGGRVSSLSSLCNPLPLFSAISLPACLNTPTVPVGVVGWLFGGAVYLARAIENSVQIGRTRSSSFEWLFLLTGFRAFESGIDCRILSIFAVNAALMLVAI